MRNKAFLWGVGWQKIFSPGFVGLAQRRRTPQYPKQVSVGVKLVFLCRLHQRVDNGAGLRALRGIRGQPVFAANGKGTDSVLGKIVGNIHLAVFQECGKVRPLVLGVGHRLGQLAARNGGQAVLEQTGRRFYGIDMGVPALFFTVLAGICGAVILDHKISEKYSKIAVFLSK